MFVQEFSHCIIFQFACIINQGSHTHNLWRRSCGQEIHAYVYTKCHLQIILYIYAMQSQSISFACKALPYPIVWRVARKNLSRECRMCRCALNRRLLWNNNYNSSYKSRGLSRCTKAGCAVCWVVSPLTLATITQCEPAFARSPPPRAHRQPSTRKYVSNLSDSITTNYPPVMDPERPRSRRQKTAAIAAAVNRKINLLIAFDPISRSNIVAIFCHYAEAIQSNDQPYTLYIYIVIQVLTMRTNHYVRILEKHVITYTLIIVFKFRNENNSACNCWKSIFQAWYKGA